MAVWATDRRVRDEEASIRAGGPRHGEAGFTLVEMLVVIAIIGLVMGLVAPVFSLFVGFKSQNGAHPKFKDFLPRLISSIWTTAVPDLSGGTRSFGSKAGRRHLVEWPLLESQFRAEGSLGPSLRLQISRQTRYL